MALLGGDEDTDRLSDDLDIGDREACIHEKICDGSHRWQRLVLAWGLHRREAHLVGDHYAPRIQRRETADGGA